MGLWQISCLHVDNWPLNWSCPSYSQFWISLGFAGSVPGGTWFFTFIHLWNIKTKGIAWHCLPGQTSLFHESMELKIGAAFLLPQWMDRIKGTNATLAFWTAAGFDYNTCLPAMKAYLVASWNARLIAKFRTWMKPGAFVTPTADFCTHAHTWPHSVSALWRPSAAALKPAFQHASRAADLAQLRALAQPRHQVFHLHHCQLRFHHLLCQTCWLNCEAAISLSLKKAAWKHVSPQVWCRLGTAT